LTGAGFLPDLEKNAGFWPEPEPEPDSGATLISISGVCFTSSGNVIKESRGGVDFKKIID